MAVLPLKDKVLHFTVWHLDREWPREICLGPVDATSAREAVRQFLKLNDLKDDGTYVARKVGRHQARGWK